MGNKVKGTLLIIGGAEDKENQCEILNLFLEKSKAEKNPIVVITTATELPKDVGDEYYDIFHRLGAKKVEVVNIDCRRSANSEQLCSLLENSGGIFFTGGDQLRITSVLGGTKANEAIFEAYLQGSVIAGTSAGASCMSGTMIVEGDSDVAPKLNTINMAPGLGLLQEVVIDQHFAQRGRTGRLLSAIAHNPYILGIGIDEDTAILVHPDAKLEIAGSQTVTFIDAKNSEDSNVSELKPGQALAVENVKLHVLPKGYGFDLTTRIPFRKDGQEGD